MRLRRKAVTGRERFGRQAVPSPAVPNAAEEAGAEPEIVLNPFSSLRIPFRVVFAMLTRTETQSALGASSASGLVGLVDKYWTGAACSASMRSQIPRHCELE
jgi:hypothetical protein